MNLPSLALARHGRHLMFAALLASTLGGLAFACGSGNEVPCQGSSCIDGGGETSSPDGQAVPDGTADAAADGSPDASACSYQEAGAGDAGDLQWAANFGVTGYTTANAVAVDPTTGDIVVAGSFDGSIDFGDGLVTSTAPSGTGDGFLARFDSRGRHKWSKVFGNGQPSQVGPVAVDASGNVVASGGFSGSMSFGGTSLAAVGDQDIFLLKLDSGGNYQWGRSFGTSGQSNGAISLAVDALADIVVGGVAQAGLDLGAGPLSGYFIAKFSAVGKSTWSKAFAISSTTSTPTLAVDPQGNVVLAGSFSGATDFGGGQVTSKGGVDAFVAKFGPSGVYHWAKQFPSVPTSSTSTANSDVSTHGVSVDQCGNIFLLGNFSTGTTITFGDSALTAPGDSNTYAFLAKLDATGNGLWSRKFAGSGLAQLSPGSVVVDGAGGPTVTTFLGGDIGGETSVDFGGGPLTSIGEGAMAVATFDATGAYRWGYAGGAPSTARVSNLAGAAASASSVVVVGSFSGPCASTCGTSPPGTTLVLGTKTFAAVSAADLVVSSFVP